jgi:TRAP-type mannitol/chloroaromatic compound transport system permease large subunit
MLPGLMLVGLYITWQIVQATMRPEMAPPMQIEIGTNVYYEVRPPSCRPPS